MPKTLDVPPVDSPRGQRIIDLLDVASRYRPELPPSREQLMKLLGWDEATFRQAMDDFAAVTKAVAGWQSLIGFWHRFGSVRCSRRSSGCTSSGPRRMSRRSKAGSSA